MKRFWHIPSDGFKFAGNFGKLFLSIFRIIAISAIGYYLWLLIKREESKIFIVSIAMIFAGALGNMIDSAFYGLLFSESNYAVAHFMSDKGGYAPFLYGKVVDMFYFPIIQGYYPDWFPFLGGRELVFFRPVFNIADSSISVGVFILIIFQKRYFTKPEVEEEEMLDPVAEDL